MGPRTVVNRCNKFRLQRNFFLYSLLLLTSSVLVSASSFFCLLPFNLYCTIYTTQISMSPAGFKPAIPANDRPQSFTKVRSAIGIGGFFVFVCAFTLYFIRTRFFVWIILHFAFCLVLQPNTNIRGPGGIQTRNPSRRSAADPCLKPLGHWDRQDSILRPFSS